MAAGYAPLASAYASAIVGLVVVSFTVDGMKDGSIRPLDQSVAAFLVSGLINASVVLDRWVPDITDENAVDLFVRPLFMGILAAAGSSASSTGRGKS